MSTPIHDHTHTPANASPRTHAPTHELSARPASEKLERALWFALWLNLAFLGVEVVLGLLADSLALLSDAGHMFFDVVALAIGLLTERLAHGQPGGSYTFGLKRLPVLGAFSNAIGLLLIVVVIVWEAVSRLRSPPEVQGVLVLITGFAGLFVNVLSAWWLHAASSHSLNARGVALHLLADALGSFGAIVAAVVLLTTGWLPIDAVVSLLIAVLIVLGTWPLLRDSAKVLLQSAPAHIDLTRVRHTLCASPIVQSTLDLHVWEIDAGLTILTADLATSCQTVAELEAGTAKLRKKLQTDFDIQHVTIQWHTTGSGKNGCDIFCNYEANDTTENTQ
jgi:cobalt-zinc-cadmium efflux system protein